MAVARGVVAGEDVGKGYSAQEAVMTVDVCGAQAQDAAAALE
jgi:hypothetical protein